LEGNARKKRLLSNLNNNITIENVSASAQIAWQRFKNMERVVNLDPV